MGAGDCPTEPNDGADDAAASGYGDDDASARGAAAGSEELPFDSELATEKCAVGMKKAGVGALRPPKEAASAGAKAKAAAYLGAVLPDTADDQRKAAELCALEASIGVGQRPAASAEIRDTCIRGRELSRPIHPGVVSRAADRVIYAAKRAEPAPSNGDERNRASWTKAKRTTELATFRLNETKCGKPASG